MAISVDFFSSNNALHVLKTAIEHTVWALGTFPAATRLTLFATKGIVWMRMLGSQLMTVCRATKGTVG